MISRLCSYMRNSIPPLVAFLFFVGSWQLAVWTFSISKLILPPPNEVASTLIKQFGYLVTHGAITLFESVLGFLLGGFIAISFAVLFQFFPKTKQAIYPYAILIKAIPLVALAPLVILWFKSGLLSKIMLAAIISFFPILVNSVRGLSSVEPEALDLMATFSASKWEVLAKLRIPNALPSLFAGMKISSTFAVVGAVVAEFIGAQRGIGYVVKSSSYYLETDLTFAAIIVTGLTGLSFFGAIALLEYKIVFWQPNSK